jgi:hypothetical protein
MKKQFSLLITLGFLNLILFSGVFKLLQNEHIYHSTLGVFSKNYERIGGWDNFEITKKSIPFLEITNDHFTNWDAGIYKCISEKMYLVEQDCYGTVRAAFFPLFPILWKTTKSTPLGISIINYLLFVVSIAVLALIILKTSLPNTLIIYSILITLPCTIIYFIPYSEALFMFTMTIACIGILKKKYWIFFLGCFLLAMVRPATVFVISAIILTEILVLFMKKDAKLFIKELLLKSLPFILGYFCAIFIQFLSSGNWLAMIDAQKNWAGKIQPFAVISDWSIEGFALSLFSIFFVCIPLIVGGIRLLVKWSKKEPTSYISKVANYNIEYLVVISALYLIGIFVFTLITSGGNLHSFFRFTLNSPLFYIIVLAFLNQAFTSQIKMHLTFFAISAISLIVFLQFVDYGGDRANFSYFGLYMFMATTLFLITIKIIPQPIKISMAILIITLTTIWNTYLLNAFFSNGWIFT